LKRIIFPEEAKAGPVLGREYTDPRPLGRRVCSLLETYEDSTGFYAPDVCFEDARQYNTGLFGQPWRRSGYWLGRAGSDRLLAQVVYQVLYRDFEQLARGRMAALMR